MRATLIGAIAGFLFAIVWIAFGFWHFIFALVLTAAGTVIGVAVERKLDVRGVWDALTGKRSSS